MTVLNMARRLAYEMSLSQLWGSDGLSTATATVVTAAGAGLV